MISYFMIGGLGGFGGDPIFIATKVKVECFGASADAFQDETIKLLAVTAPTANTVLLLIGVATTFIIAPRL